MMRFQTTSKLQVTSGNMARCPSPGKPQGATSRSFRWPARKSGTQRALVLPFVLAAAVFASGCSEPAAKHIAPMSTVDFEFISDGRKLSGVLDQPAEGQVRALVLLIHGTGMTDIRQENRYARLRQRMSELGVASFMWDKPGRGRSEGTFNDNQPLESAAQEILDAIAKLRAQKIPGSDHVGVWSISRGGWVAPIALSQDPSIKFWISVGGPAAEDNKHYLMQANLPLEGRTPGEVAQLMEEWRQGRRIFFAGGSYEEYLAATSALRKDPLVFEFAGDLTGTAEVYAAEQRAYLQAKDFIEVDPTTTAGINVRGFDAMLSRLDIDVLALFGELDTNIDWRRTRALYESTIGRNPDARLHVRTFPGCNHMINPSATGTVREVQAAPAGGGDECAGYYDVQMEWLGKHLMTVE